MNILYVLKITVLVLSLFNLIKIAISLIGNELFDLRQKRPIPRWHEQRDYQPIITVVVPAYNEEKSIERTLRKVFQNDYPKMEVIVVDDGSQDQTSTCVRRFRRETGHLVQLIQQPNGGKSVAINNAVKNFATGELIMVLDADSQLAPDAVRKMVAHFRDNRILALAANVKMLSLPNWLGILQRFEFLSAYRGKCAEDRLRHLYIIGGIGSTFRRNAMLAVGMYDTDTLTEDIDFTMKLVRTYGNTAYRIGYVNDVIVYTEPVQRFKSLLKQRFRWKYGRFKAFLKYRDLFFRCDKKYSKMITWYTLPNALLQEVFMLIEPLMFLYIQGILIYYVEWQLYLSMLIFWSVLIILALWGDSSESWSQRFKLFAVVPLAYWGMFTLTMVDFVALLKSIRKSRDLIQEKDQHASWEHVERL